MERLIRQIQFGASMLVIATLFTNATLRGRELANVNEDVRADHAKELIGTKNFTKSAVSKTLGYSAINQFILDETEKRLPKKHEKDAIFVANAIISEANKHQLDPLFIMAIIRQESAFNPDAVGGVGELGLMQIRPQTGEWIAKKFGLEWTNANSLKDPVTNIMIGTQYIAYLRAEFGHGRLYLSAYNMGPNKVKTKMNEKYWPIIYSSGVMKRYISLNKTLISHIAISKAADAKIVAANN